jgi:hypothetical protein
MRDIHDRGRPTIGEQLAQVPRAGSVPHGRGNERPGRRIRAGRPGLSRGSVILLAALETGDPGVDPDLRFGDAPSGLETLGRPRLSAVL